MTIQNSLIFATACNRISTIITLDAHYKRRRIKAKGSAPSASADDATKLANATDAQGNEHDNRNGQFTEKGAGKGMEHGNGIVEDVFNIIPRERK